MSYKNGYNGFHVLVIRDDHTFNAPLSDMLTSEGYQVSTVFSGEDGLTLLKKNPCEHNLIILDNVFLVSSWFNLLSKISSTPIVKKIPSIILINQTESFYVNTALKHAAFGILCKPVEDDILLDVINSALQEKENVLS